MLRIASLPVKTKYSVDETAIADYTGLKIEDAYDDGTVHDVTSFCSFSPAQGTFLTGSTEVTVSCASPAEPYAYDINYGYVLDGAWIPQNPTNTWVDVYKVKAGYTYLLTLGAVIGSRFQVIFATNDITKNNVRTTGISLAASRSPAPYDHVSYTPAQDGYIVVGKDNVGVSGLKTYLYSDEKPKT